MSGICGILRTDNHSIDYSQISTILDNMKNRGNDKKEIKIKDNTGFGHAMLWTTMESLSEEQPIISSDDLYLLTADARVDNREELVEKLQHRIGNKTPSDSQLILMAYQEWAEECPLHIVGDFAFAIKDNIKKQLFCARDRIGIKPFYYFFNDQSFVFSSEISSLFTHENIIKKPNVQAIQDYLNSLSIAYEQTFFQGIMRLPASHYMIIKDNKLSISRYWFPEKIQINNQISYEDATIKVRQLLTDAIASCMRSTYPIACELSGGIDSSSILCIAEECKTSQFIFPLTMRYKDMKCDEGKYSNAVLEHLNIKGMNLWLDSSDTIKEVESYYKRFSDWPINGEFSGIIAESEVAKEKNIRIILTGQGGDDIFAGTRYVITDLFTTFQWGKLYEELKYYNFSKSIIYNYLISPFLSIKLDSMIKNFFSKNDNSTSLPDLMPLKSFLDEAYIKTVSQRRELYSLMGTTTAVWTNNNLYQSLEHYNIEVRHPFFDSRLIEFVLSLPPEYKYKNGKSKRILRSSIKNVVPECVINREDKAEFSESICHKIAKIDLKNFLEKSSLIEYEVLKKSELEEDVKKFYDKTLEHITPFWTKILLDLWFKENFDILSKKV